MIAIKVFGERNTSTNALIKAILRNIEHVNVLPSTASELNKDVALEINRIHSAHDGLDRAAVRESYIDSIFSNCSLRNTWKHAATNFNSLQDCSDVKFIFTVRHPASWLLALHKRPYHALQKVEQDFDKFIVQPWKTVQRDRLSEICTTPIGLWNLKCKSYIDFLKKFDERGNCFIVRFEDFSQSQEQALFGLLKSFGLEKERFQEVVNSSKGDDKNVKWYRDYYGKECWRKEITDSAWSVIKSNVDPVVCEFFSYEV